MVELDHKRIVITFLMHLGDVVLTTPFLEVLRKAAPHSHITYVVDEKLKDLVSENPYIDDVVTVDKKGRDNSIGALNRIAKEIRARYKPDIVINLHPNERTSFLAWRIGAPYLTGMCHFLFRPFWSKYTRLDRVGRHAADMYINVLEQLGVAYTEQHGLCIATQKEWEQEATHFYETHGVKSTDRLVGFNIGSAVPQKRWPPERFAVVADALAAKGFKPIFFGGTMDEAMVQEASSHMQTTPLIGTGRFGLGPLAAAISRCDLFITNDSGPMHIAVSQNIPIIALYGPSNPKYYGPYTDKAIILESTTDYVVGKSMKQIIKEGKYQGLSVIESDTVIAAAKELLHLKD